MNAKIKNGDDSLEVKLLNYIGNAEPSESQLGLIRRLVSQINVSQQLLFDAQLTLHEQHCLFYAAHGYSAKQTAIFLGFDLRTVKYYREEILRKLECANMAHAVFVGLKYGYIVPYGELNMPLLGKRPVDF